MRDIGVDIRVVGLMTLAQAPWTFKVLWSPLMDRYAVPWLGRRRGWAAVSQLVLLALTLWLVGVGGHPEAPWVVGALALAIAFASATQDIAIDAYAVDILLPDEQGVAVGARTAIYRAAMYVSGGLSITLAAQYSWPFVNFCLALLYLPMLAITWKAPEAEERPAAPKTLREAIWSPFVGVFQRSRALEILALWPAINSRIILPGRSCAHFSSTSAIPPSTVVSPWPLWGSPPASPAPSSVAC
jgi:PAT family beta-lactamase induction signal transducer AmpG